ncbi:unnamed protein product [Didymodactylos carnosus]|uniref:Uncharacterized protein n=1 Tax=Didymodactylos carnosus TaxID=1234261 RepID=A0A8S2EWU3_9BILA|nr:unnamed protein product [Didymodactylos carnosus]CAF4141222.1 unnamed protein product [Didymodactylos carnosus]
MVISCQKIHFEILTWKDSLTVRSHERYPDRDIFAKHFGKIHYSKYREGARKLLIGLTQQQREKIIEDVKEMYPGIAQCFKLNLPFKNSFLRDVQILHPSLQSVRNTDQIVPVNREIIKAIQKSSSLYTGELAKVKVAMERMENEKQERRSAEEIDKQILKEVEQLLLKQKDLQRQQQGARSIISDDNLIKIQKKRKDAFAKQEEKREKTTN